VKQFLPVQSLQGLGLKFRNLNVTNKLGILAHWKKACVVKTQKTLYFVIDVFLMVP